MSIQPKNIKLANQLNQLADLSDIDGASFWKIKAYRSAADTIKNLDIPITSIKDLKGLPGVGKSISKKIKQFLDLGCIVALSDLEDKYPVEALSMTIVPGIGAKTAFKFHQQGIKNFKDLIKASEAGKISNQNIMRGIKLAVKSQGRISINRALPIAKTILKALRDSPYVERASLAGSIRRGKETIKDIDIVVVPSDKSKVINLFQSFGDELVNGNDKTRIIAPIDTHTSVQVDLLFTSPKEFGASLAYFTGSKEHNIALRSLAASKRMKINEHGFWCLKTGERLGGAEEKDLYDLLNLPYTPPELREGNTLLNEVPDLISRDDITSDWHMHTKWSSDAKNSFEEMAKAAKQKGLKKIGVSDHTEKQYKWDPERIEERYQEAAQAAKLVGIEIFAGCETGINLDGSLDWPDKYLNKMDFVIASIHKSHNKDVTKRLLRAIEHPKVQVIGHPTGRMIGRRDIPEADWGIIFEKAAAQNVLIEINGARIDLPINLIKLAKSKGCKFVINSDAHSVDHFDWQDTGIVTARRAGLLKTDIKIPEVEYE